MSPPWYVLITNDLLSAKHATDPRSVADLAPCKDSQKVGSLLSEPVTHCVSSGPAPSKGPCGVWTEGLSPSGTWGCFQRLLPNQARRDALASLLRASCLMSSYYKCCFSSFLTSPESRGAGSLSLGLSTVSFASHTEFGTKRALCTCLLISGLRVGRRREVRGRSMSSMTGHPVDHPAPTFVEHRLCAQVGPCDPPSKPPREVRSWLSLYRWGIPGTERPSNLPKVTQPRSDRIKIPARGLL